MGRWCKCDFAHNAGCTADCWRWMGAARGFAMVGMTGCYGSRDGEREPFCVNLVQNLWRTETFEKIVDKGRRRC